MFNRFKQTFAKHKKDIVEFCTYSFCIYAGLDFIGNHVAFGTLCSGPSMEPTISKSGDGVLVYCVDKYKIGDIVVSKCPSNPKKRKYFNICLAC